MDTIKKTGIIAGAVIGGIVGGGISLVGKLAKVKIVDDIGSSITSSSILTGELTGTLASGTVDAVTGKISKNSKRTEEGVNDLKRTGKQVVNNVFTNVDYIIENRKEPKKLAKFLAVGTITVGAVKMTDADEK